MTHPAPTHYISDNSKQLVQHHPKDVRTPIAATMAQPTYYIDEDVGQDIAEQTGDESLPYKSLGYAVLTRGETPKFLTRKSVTGEIAEGADAS